MSNNVSPGLFFAWRIAAAEAGLSGAARIGCGHLLLGLLSLGKVDPRSLVEMGRDAVEVLPVAAEGAAIAALLGGDDRVRDLRRALRPRLIVGEPQRRGVISRSPAAKAAFTRATLLAQGRDPNALHLLSVLIRDPDPVVEAFMAAERLSPDIAVRAADRATESLPSVTPEAPRRSRDGAGSSKAGRRAEAEDTRSALERFGRDLSALAARREIGPVIGRRKEILAVLQTLARSTKSNPVLVGEAGVGKTAIVEAIALRGVAGKDPEVLAAKTIIELNVGALLAGTEYRGEFEKRMREVLDELKARPEVILFIDEIHLLVGAGRAGGGPDAANLMKPALARGEIRVIGATTVAEYRDCIEKDAALERRFDRIEVGEPSEDEALEILRGLKERLERHHRVRYEDEALEAAVRLSVRFDTDHRLPDKAVDLVDKAGARARVPALSRPAANSGGDASFTGATVDARLVAEVLAAKRGLPVELVASGASSASRLLELEGFLKKRILGQDPALAAIASRVRLAHAGLEERRGPLAVFLLLGPTGVGKTETARCLAEFLFGSADDLVRFDMSEYMEEHSLSRLVGSPPGYVGHEEPGQLTDSLRRKPYCVLLFDEVEKAHPRVFDLFLQLFDAGRLTDAQGRVADARHALVVMTSNLGVAKAPVRVGFASSEDLQAAALDPRAAEDLKHFFRPELINRIDDVVAFQSLGETDVRRIAGGLLDSLAASLLKSHGVALRFEASAVDVIAQAGFDAAGGARGLKRAVERLAGVPLSSLALSGKLAEHAAWKAVGEGGGIYFLPE